MASSPYFGAVAVLLKGVFFYWVIMWIKYTVPRIRIDHMLAFNWKFLTPLSFVLLMVTAVMNRLLAGVPTWEYVAGMFLSNAVIIWITIELLRARARRERRAVEAERPVASAAGH